MIETLSERVALSNLLNKMVERSTKNIMLTHARSRGATEVWIDSIKNLNVETVTHVVTVMYGEPDIPLEIKKTLDKAKQ